MFKTKEVPFWAWILYGELTFGLGICVGWCIWG
jgi:hypothetical protein